MKDIFTKIYINNLWGEKESRSGPGSTLKETRFLRKELEFLLQILGIHSFLDAPCGDFNWMKEVSLDGVDYLGGDIVSELILSNTRKFPRHKFIEMDITSSQIPCVDLILCRDCFMHLSYIDIMRTINNFKRSGSKYLLATSHTWKAQKNEDITCGKYRRLNLMLPPFCFPCPLDFIVEGNSELDGAEADRSVCLWRLDSIPFFDNSNSGY